MDIAKPANLRRNRIRRAAFATAGLLVLGALSYVVFNLKPAAPGIERNTLYIDNVKRGPLVREVRGTGVLLPEDTRWIPATTQGRVERIILRPGTAVKADTVVLELSNPQLDQEVQDAALKLRAAEASLQQLRVQANNDYLQQQANAAAIAGEFQKARMQAEMNEALAAEQLVSLLSLRQAKVEAEQLALRNDLAQQQLATYEQSLSARLAVAQSEVDQVRAVLQLRQRQRGELQVRAGLDGILQVVPVEVGQQVTPGANLARVADPSRLKAEVRIPETQAKDIQIGQRASVDTHNGLVTGIVNRIDPSVQNGTITIDVTLTGTLPKGAVPDLSIDGTIELERLADVLFVGRPSVAQERASIGLFKLGANGEAIRVPVQIGRMSVSLVEVVSGLAVGDQVVLSDMSAWDAHDRVRLQ
ncbi:MAG: efflux RND transporter periplasmic adaptor subunit [Vicinamibacterales bacterium]